MLIELDSLPPLCVDSPTAEAERALARDVLEHAVLLAVRREDKGAFQRHLSSLRPYYTNSAGIAVSESQNTILGLNLLYLLVENRLSDFHCELELLSEQQQAHPAIAFCTKLDRHLMVGSYDQVMAAAANPPLPKCPVAGRGVTNAKWCATATAWIARSALQTPASGAACACDSWQAMCSRRSSGRSRRFCGAAG